MLGISCFISGFETETSCWNNVVADYSDVFAEPGMPAERETKHKIELLPGAMTQYRHWYCVSAAELAEIRR